MTPEVLEVIMRLNGQRAMQAGLKETAASMREVGAAADQTNVKSAAASKRNVTMMGAMKTAAKGTALIVAGTIFEAYKMGTAFDTAMLKVQTQAGASHKEMENMRKGVLDLATSGRSMGTGPQSLAEGLYHLESLQIRGAKALHGLELASQLAAVSGASMAEATSAMGAAMFVGIKGAGGLDHIVALLNATVGQGNMKMEELVHALGTGVLSSAKVAGLGITDVMAALAVFSDSGQQASSAAAQFATALHFMEHPTTKAQGALATLHLTAQNMSDALHGPNGMVAGLSLLRNALSALPGGLTGFQAEQVLGDIFPGGRGRVLQTELVMLDRANAKWHAINKQATGAEWAKTVAAQKKNPATQLHTAVAELQGDLIHLYDRYKGPMTAILVTILHVADALVKALGPAVGFLATNKTLVLTLIGAWVTYKSVMVAAFVAQRAEMVLTNAMFGRFPLMMAGASAESGALGAASAEAGTKMGTILATRMSLAIAAGIAGWEIGTWLRKHVIDPLEAKGQKNIDKKNNNILQQQVDHSNNLHKQFQTFQKHAGGRGGGDILSWQQRMARDPHERTYRRHRDAQQHYTNSIFGMSPRPRANGASVGRYRGAAGQAQATAPATLPEGAIVIHNHLEASIQVSRREIARAVADDARQRQAHR